VVVFIAARWELWGWMLGLEEGRAHRQSGEEAAVVRRLSMATWSTED